MGSEMCIRDSMSPSLNITTEDIDFIVLNLKKSIVSVTDGLVRSGHKIS